MANQMTMTNDPAFRDLSDSRDEGPLRVQEVLRCFDRARNADNAPASSARDLGRSQGAIRVVDTLATQSRDELRAILEHGRLRTQSVFGPARSVGSNAFPPRLGVVR